MALGRGMMTIILSITMFSIAVAQDDLARWIPPSSNTIAVVRAKDLFASPLGQQQRWSQRQREAYTAGEIALPPGVDLLVRATEFRITGEATTSYSIMQTAQDAAVRNISQRDKTALEKVQDRVAVHTRGMYFAQLGTHLMAAVQPDDRQVLSRWLKASTTTTSISPFLQTAAFGPGNDAQIIIAVELVDMFDTATLARWLKSNPGGEKFANVDALASLFATVHGARLSVKVTDAISGQMQLTFGQPVGNLSQDVGRLVMAWADETGARIDSTGTPTITGSGNTVTLARTLDLEGLRRIISLIQSPHTPLHETATQPRADMPDVEASSHYFQAVNKLVDSLNRQNRNANDYLKTATWHENFARQIDNLPIDGVDPELVDWSRAVSEQLKGLATSLRGVPIEVNELQKSIRYDVNSRNYRYASNAYGNFYRNAGYDVDTNLVEIRAKQSDIVNNNAAERDAVWRMIQQARADMGKRMHDKYGGAFKLK
jgi:hypothetical protein